jgi:[acyl-carrier-protein] S-malonyltransferase
MDAWLFPGHGSQYAGMGGWCRTDTNARELFDMAETLSDLPIRRAMARGPISDLTRPDILEPALVALQIAQVERLRRQAFRPDAVAGYSVGEIAALYTAGVLSRIDAVRFAATRGRLLQSLADRGSWCMVAVSRIDCGELAPAFASLMREGSFAIGAFNARDHITITGVESAVGRAEALAVTRGAACARLDVAGPWHSMIARDIATDVAALLASISFRVPTIPVWLGTTGAREERPAECRRVLADQLWRPVLWTNVLTGLWAAGVRSTLEIGPGHTLTGYLRRNWPAGRYSAAFLERENGRSLDTADLARLRERIQPAAVVS